MDVGEITSDDYEISTINGQLEITLAELSRLNLDESVSHVFCTFAAGNDSHGQSPETPFRRIQ